MSYDPRSFNDRTNLSKRLQTMLVEAGFAPTVIKGTREKVFARPVDGKEGVRVLVYTTIDGARVRACGKDAIRVCAVYMSKDGRERGIASADKRVHRTGSIDAIVDRTLSRMREVYGAVAKGEVERCSCGAPKFKSKRGNMVCADLCWTKGQAAPSRRRRRHAPRINRATGTAEIDFAWDDGAGFTDMNSLPHSSAPW